MGYPEEDIDFNAKKVEFHFRNSSNKTRICIEAKGSKTEDLHARQNYSDPGQKTPYIQTYTNMLRFPSDYGLTTNYRKFILNKSLRGNLMFG